MNNLETNALRIAELMGWKYQYTDRWSRIETYSKNKIVKSSVELKRLFSSYNGLMPIVFKCNKSDVDYPININPHQIKAYPDDALDIYSYDTEPEFIDAIQECVIKYLELKNDNSRVQQTI